MMRILAVDPGRTNGIAFRNSSGNISSVQIAYVDHGEALPLAFYNFIVNFKPELIAYESYNFIQGRTGNDYTPVEMIGIINLYSQMYKIGTHPMTSGQAKGFWSDDKIKALDLWIPGQRHGMDALRVLLTHLMSTDSYFRADALAKLKTGLK